MSEVDSPSYKKATAKSSYYIKAAETKTETDALQPHDEIQIKDGQL